MTSLTASLAKIPHAAQITVTPTGDGGNTWTLRGATTDGRYAWDVRGGSGFVRDGPVILIDPEVPLEVPVRYTLRAGSASATSTSILIPGPGKGWGVLSSAQGRQPAVFKWLHSLDEQHIEPRLEKFAIQGRSLPAIRRDEIAGAGGGSIPAETSGILTQRMMDLLMLNEPMSLRTHGYMLDRPLVEHIIADNVTLALAEKKLARVWRIEYSLSAFYAFSAATAPATTVGEVAALGMTVGEVAATGLNVGQVAAGGLTP